MPASIMSVTLTNWLVTQTVPPRLLPKLDFKDGLPDDMAAAVVVPVIFGKADEVAPLLDQLEAHWLTNPDPRLFFAILGDPADGPHEDMAQDAQILAALIDGIAQLNGRYPGHRPFAVLHRRRRGNPGERVWMGWERKRGKLEEFNLFLADRAENAFPVQAGNIDALRNARYVVTLDAETVVPPGAVNRPLGALCHPLNRVEFDAAGELVLAGYTFIQPRIEISPRVGGASRFSRLYTGDTAIDIFSRAVSVVYQDLFGAGIFTGKGADDVAAFRQCLVGRVPENALVGHDLFEGLHGRAALASDIVFYEGFPTSYPQYVRRLHRWIRGDWQLLPRLGRRVPGRGGVRLKKPAGRAGPLEDHRQLAPQPDPARAGAACGHRLAGPARRGADLDAADNRRAGGLSADRRAGRAVPRPPSRCGPGPATPVRRSRLAIDAGGRVHGDRGAGRPRYRPAGLLAHGVVAPPVAGMDDGGPCRRGRARRPRPCLGRNGRRASTGVGHWQCVGTGHSRRRAIAAAVVQFARDRAVHRTFAPVAGGGKQHRGQIVPAPPGAPDLAVFRNFRRPRGQLATARKFSDRPA